MAMQRILVKTEKLFKDIESGKAFKGMDVNEEKAYVASKLASLILFSLKEEVEYRTNGFCHTVSEAWAMRVAIDPEQNIQWGAKSAALHGVSFDIIEGWLGGMASWFDYDGFSYHNCLDLNYFNVTEDLNKFANDLVEWVLLENTCGCWVVSATTTETGTEATTTETTTTETAEESTTETETTTTETESTETESTVRLRKMIHLRARDKALLAERQLIVSRQRRAGRPRQT